MSYLSTYHFFSPLDVHCNPPLVEDQLYDNDPTHSYLMSIDRNMDPMTYGNSSTPYEDIVELYNVKPTFSELEPVTPLPTMPVTTSVVPPTAPVALSTSPIPHPTTPTTPISHPN